MAAHSKYLMRCDYTIYISSTISVDKIALYDSRDYDNEKILDAIRKGYIEDLKYVVVCNKHDYEAVFRSLTEDN